VPAWLGIFLREQHKCSIQLPPIYRVEELANFVERENATSDPVFLHEDCFFELAHTLLNKAPDTFAKPREVRNLIESLETIRFEKFRKIIEERKARRQHEKHEYSKE